MPVLLNLRSRRAHLHFGLFYLLIVLRHELIPPRGQSVRHVHLRGVDPRPVRRRCLLLLLRGHAPSQCIHIVWLSCYVFEELLIVLGARVRRGLLLLRHLQNVYLLLMLIPARHTRVVRS